MRLNSFKTAAAASILLAPAVSAWGSLGHITVATIASSFVTNTTEAYLQDLLGISESDYMSSVATWADSYRYTKAGRFTHDFHFIDAKDSPPNYCGVQYDRDCKASGCVVSAIQNYTERILNVELSSFERSMAAKFLIHFIGDIHQPLHTEDVAKGGNGIKVLYNGRNANLHGVWDSSIPEDIAQTSHRRPQMGAERWAAKLVGEMQDGKYKSQRDQWLKGLDITNPKDTAMLWANDANKFVCSTVLPDGPEVIEGQELHGQYSDAATPVIEVLVASSGYRLAKYMDAIVEAITASRSHPKKDVTATHDVEGAIDL